MREIANRHFEMLGDGGTRVISDLRLLDCVFDNCYLSRVDSPAHRSVVKSVQLIRCRNFNSHIGPARIEDVLVQDFRSNDLFILWAPLFRHVKLQGVIRSFKINRWYSVVDHHPIRQRAFDEDAANFYNDIDWAIDLSEAKLSNCEIEGVPIRLIRYDARYGLAISRQSAERPNWESRVSAANPWRFRIQLFLRGNEHELLLLAPYGHRAEREALQELASAGLSWEPNSA
jgi:hypothetical protein